MIATLQGEHDGRCRAARRPRPTSRTTASRAPGTSLSASPPTRVEVRRNARRSPPLVGLRRLRGRHRLPRPAPPRPAPRSTGRCRGRDGRCSASPTWLAPRRRPHAAAGRRRPGRPDPARPRPGAACRGARCDHVEHTPRRGLLRDGRLVLVAAQRRARARGRARPAPARRHGRLARLLYGAPFAVPLGLSTRVVGAGDDLTAALRALAGGRAAVDGQARGRRADGGRAASSRRGRRPSPPDGSLADPGRRARAIGEVAHRSPSVPTRAAAASSTTAPVVASATPGPLREPATGAPRRGHAATSPAERRRARGPRAAPPRQRQPGRGDPGRGATGSAPIARPGDAGRAAGHRRLRGRARRGPGHRPGARRRPHPPRPDRRPARRAHPHPPARHRVHRGRRLRARAAATSTPAATCAPWPACSASTWRRCWRRTTSATPTPRSTRAGSSRPSWPPAPTARSAAPAAARTGRCWSPR